MTPLPKRRLSSRRQGKRRSANWRITLPALVPCANCHQPRFPHRACPHCGFYKGKKVS